MEKPINPRLCHVCNGPHFIKDCNETICLKCTPNNNIHTLSKCPRRHPSNQQFNNSTSHNHTSTNTLDANNYTEPNLQLSVSTNKLDQMAELLEATKQMMKYFKKSLKQTPKHTITKECHQNKYQNKQAHHLLIHADTNHATTGITTKRK